MYIAQKKTKENNFQTCVVVPQAFYEYEDIVVDTKVNILVTLNINSFFRLSSAGRPSRVFIADVKSSENPERAEETRKLCAPTKTNLFPA